MSKDNTEGLPETGYGSWAEWRERGRKLNGGFVGGPTNDGSSEGAWWLVLHGGSEWVAEVDAARICAERKDAPCIPFRDRLE